MPKHYGVRATTPPPPIEVRWHILMDDLQDETVTLYVEGGESGPELVTLKKGDSITMTHTVSFK